jgi:uncharacterized protein YbjT (DUF2867 family)
LFRLLGCRLWRPRLDLVSDSDSVRLAAPDDPKNAHLWALDGAAERLTMLQVDLLDRASLRAAFRGCDGVIHTASPMHDNPVSAAARRQ